MFQKSDKVLSILPGKSSICFAVFVIGRSRLATATSVRLAREPRHTCAAATAPSGRLTASSVLAAWRQHRIVYSSFADHKNGNRKWFSRVRYSVAASPVHARVNLRRAAWISRVFCPRAWRLPVYAIDFFAEWAKSLKPVMAKWF